MDPDLLTQSVHLAQVGLSTTDARAWLAKNAIPLIAICVGLVAMIAAMKQEVGKIASIVLGLVFALAIVGIGLIDGAPEAVAKFIAGLFT